MTRDNVQLLINQIFQLTTAKVDNEIVIKLPPPTTRLPRAKPVPKAKQLTKWEKYAKEKGITSRKKSKTEWDEDLKVTTILHFIVVIQFSDLIFLLEMGTQIWIQKSIGREGEELGGRALWDSKGY